MRKRVYILALLLLILSTNVAFGAGNKTKSTKSAHKTKIKPSDRIKRSANYDENDQQFWANRGKRQVINKGLTKDDSDYENRKLINLKNKLHNEQPFWGNRGRRSSEENYSDYTDNNYYEGLKPDRKLGEYPSLKDRREDSLPFWGNRGRRNSDEIPVDNDVGPFWSSRGRRQEEEPFWGTRGRRDNNLPFWGNRGRRESEPFWGSRGRRQDEEPFWGNRGKKEIEESEPFWGNRGRRKEDFKESIIEAINKVEDDIDNLSKLKRSSVESSGHFWKNRERNSQLKHLFDGTRPKNQREIGPYDLTAKPSVSSTMLDDRIYADQPHYIIVERSSRSSGELDPYFISRGKKKNFYQTARGRRNAIEEIVKSVRNDPFYIVRGKKDFGEGQVANSNHTEFQKAKALICATIELTFMNERKHVKREINEDRDRRNILKKLAAQLQNDPYFVSRGKKNETKENEIREFISQVAAMCN